MGRTAIQYGAKTFRVGSRVRAISNVYLGFAPTIRIGMVGTIVEVCASPYPVRVKFPAVNNKYQGDGRGVWLWYKEFELVD
jgi:hypothetical protein